MWKTISDNIFVILVVSLILTGVTYGSYLVYLSYQQTIDPPMEKMLSIPTIERYQIPQIKNG